MATDEPDDFVYCERVLVMVRGRIAAEVPGGRLDRTAMIAMIEGVAPGMHETSEAG